MDPASQQYSEYVATYVRRLTANARRADLWLWGLYQTVNVNPECFDLSTLAASSEAGCTEQ